MAFRYRTYKKIYKAVKKGRVSAGTAQYLVRHPPGKNYANPVAQRRRPQ